MCGVQLIAILTLLGSNDCRTGGHRSKPFQHPGVTGMDITPYREVATIGRWYRSDAGARGFGELPEYARVPVQIQV